ncbi:MAG: glycosyltransferase, partial [Oscillospiraceae bacterium]|nr:glycosyltransferase [Oscillospiraceae bacterium]
MERNASFSRKVSVIVPVYNVEKYLAGCLDSLAQQTMPKDEMEVLLINDGSTDGSAAVCESYAVRYEWIRFSNRQNEGVSATRNYGLRSAAGKFIFFLDSDDTLSANTLQGVCDFFEAHYDMVDLVTYSLIYRYQNGRESSHQRYGILTHDQVYDIEKYPDIAQTTMNICVKNVPDPERIYFNTSLKMAEDQTFIMDWVMRKRRLGFVSAPTYYYYRHDASASSTGNHPSRCFGSYTAVLDRFLTAFADRDGHPSRYAQGVVLYNLNWRIQANQLVSMDAPAHELELQWETIRQLVRRLDDDVITESVYPSAQVRLFLGRLKEKDFHMLQGGGWCAVYADGRLWSAENRVRLVITRIIVRGDRLRLIGFLESIHGNITRMRLFVTDKNPLPREVAFMTQGKGKPKNPTEIQFYAPVDVQVDLAEETNICFRTEINDMPFPTKCFYRPAPDLTAGKLSVFRNRRLLHYDPIADVLTVRMKTPETAAEAWTKNQRSVQKRSKQAAQYRALAARLPKGAIWLYSDRLDGADNACHQFCHDVRKRDGVRRYYVTQEPHKLTGLRWRERRHVLRFGGLRHKLLYLRCSKILTSFSSPSMFCPFGSARSLYEDITDCEVIYLQHGILHAWLPTLYNRDKIACDRIVISTEFERKNFVENYYYRPEDLLFTGMARYDTMRPQVAPQRRILLAPSWRKNLIGELVDNQRAVNEAVFLSSDYYKQWQAFLCSPRLAAFLERYDYTAEFQSHPIFRAYDHLFELASPRVRICTP